MKKLGLSIAIASAMGLTACGGGSGGGSSDSGTSLSGAASKGIVIGGKVSAYLFGSDGIPQTTSIATATTNSSGEYSLNIPSQHKGKPIYIVVDDNDGTATMKCDIASGCDKDGDVSTTDDITPFGQTYDLDSGELEMTAVLGENTGNVSINITPLTTVAAQVAKSVIASGTVTDFNIKEAVANANSQVSNRFGLTGSITSQPVVDLTNAAKVAASASNSEALKYASINAAIVAAMQADSVKKIGEAVKGFADDFAANGLANNAVDDAKTDLAEILAKASTVITKVKETVTAELGEEDASLAALTTLGGDIEDEQAENEAETPSDQGDKGTASPTANAEKLAQVKAFVEELRELGTAIENSEVISGESSQTVKAIADNFEAQLDAADLASSDDVGYSIDAMGEALNAIVSVYDNNFDVNTGELLTPSEENDAQIQSLASPVPVNFEGITVTVSKAGEVITLSVDQTITVLDDLDNEHDVEVSISSVINELYLDEDVTETENYNETTDTYTWSDQGSGNGKADISFTGSANTSIAKVSLLEGTGAKANLVFSFNGNSTDAYDSGNYKDHADFTATGFDLALKVKVEQLVAAEGQTGGLMSFTGSLDAEISSLRYIEDSNGSWSNDWTNEVWTWTDKEFEDQQLRLGTVSLVLAGTFKNDEESFDARLSLDGNGNNINFRDIYNYTASNNGSTETHQSSGETASSYSSATIKLDFTADLAGISPDGEEEIDFSFQAKRTGFDDLETSVSLAYPGRTIDIIAQLKDLDTDASNGMLTLKNNDGVQIVVKGMETLNDEDDITVEIRMDTNGDGKVDSNDFLFGWYEERNGIDLLVFADDKDADNISFESLF